MLNAELELTRCGCAARRQPDECEDCCKNDTPDTTILLEVDFTGTLGLARGGDWVYEPELDPVQSRPIPLNELSGQERAAVERACWKELARLCRVEAYNRCR